MTGRTVPEWIGETPDTAIPPRVRLRVWERFNGACAECTRKIRPGESWICDHKKALCNSGENRESNLRLICENCDRTVKTPSDVADKAETYRKRSKHLGIAKPSRPMPGGKASPWKRKFGGAVVRRDAE